MHNDQESTLTHSLSRHLRLGAISLVVLLGGGLTWAICTNLSGAVIATGTLAVEGSVKKDSAPHRRRGRRVTGQGRPAGFGGGWSCCASMLRCKRPVSRL